MVTVKQFRVSDVDGNNCGLITCLKIMELFHAIDVEGAREVYKKITFVNL